MFAFFAALQSAVPDGHSGSSYVVLLVSLGVAGGALVAVVEALLTRGPKRSAADRTAGTAPGGTPAAPR